VNPDRRSDPRFAGTRGVAQLMLTFQLGAAVRRMVELGLQPHGLSVAQFHLLGALKSTGGVLSTGEIARIMLRASQTVTGLVDRLEAQGLVERELDQHDRRKANVRITQAGERRLTLALPTANDLAERMASPLSDEELRDLEAKMRKLLANAWQKLAAGQEQAPDARRGR
jgi:DNA-binding MarR family transcriptional regulator